MTLDLARSLGWPAPIKATAHGGLVLQCPAGDARHRIRIFSTGRGSERVARDARKKIQRCQHSPAAEAILGRIVLALDNAERWIRAAEAQQAKDDAERDLDRLVDAVEASKQLLAQVDEEFARLVEQTRKLDEELEALLESPRPDPDQLVQRAAGDLRDAHLELREAPGDAPQLSMLRERFDGLSQRLAVVRARITS